MMGNFFDKDASVHRRNITDTKFHSGYERTGQIEVLLSTDGDLDAYLEECDEADSVGTRRYLRVDDRALYTNELCVCVQHEMYDREDEEDFKVDSAAWKFFENEYLQGSTPLKIARLKSLREEGGTAGSFLNKRGDLIDSYRDLIESMPREALDVEITIQAKPIERDLPPCRLCEEILAMSDADESDETRPTVEQTQRHNLHHVDDMLSVAPYRAGDEQTLFLGQEGQLISKCRLRDVLVDRSYKNEGMKVCVAQVNIYSKEESNVGATVNKNGSIVFEDDHTLNKAPLAALLPWIRVPSFLLPTKNGKVEIQEINFWMCPEECQTNTHYDGHHNVLMVLHGSKTVELSPPGAIRGSPIHGNHVNHPYLLRCKQVGGHLNHPTSDFVADTKSYGKDELSCKDNNIVVLVAAGEAIFIPEGWWHRVESSDDCVSINIWFTHNTSSLGSIVKNQHQLPYQAREMVRLYVQANIEDINKSRRGAHSLELMDHIGCKVGGWTRNPGRPIRQLFDALEMGRLIPEERTDGEIANGMAIIERYASQLLGVSEGEEVTSEMNHIQPLRLLALPLAIKSLGIMISMLFSLLDPEKQRERIAMMAVFQRFPPVTTHHQRQIFESLVKSMTQGACYVLSIAWEKHGSVAEAEASHTSFFGRCSCDEGRKHFMKAVDAFHNESARRLILGDLMLLNPSAGDGAKRFQAM